MTAERVQKLATVATGITLAAGGVLAAEPASAAPRPRSDSQRVTVTFTGGGQKSFDRSGSHAVNRTITKLTAGAWSGYVYRTVGASVFCDGAQQDFGSGISVRSIYLSPTKIDACR